MYFFDILIVTLQSVAECSCTRRPTARVPKTRYSATRPPGAFGVSRIFCNLAL